MLTFNSSITINTGFGIGQDRVIVTAAYECGAPAAQHLSSWHAGLGLERLRRELKRRVRSVVTGAVRMAGPWCSAVSGPRLCRQPVPRFMRASVSR